MKKFISILALVLVTVAFAQAQRAGSFYGDLPLSAVSNLTLLGFLPPNAFISDIRLMEGTKTTNVECTNSVQVGLVSQTNYFLISTQAPVIPAAGVIRPTTACTNVGIIISQRSPTAVYGYLTRVGAIAGAVVGSVRVVIDYVQK